MKQELVDAVRKQMQYTKKEEADFKQTLKDVANHGANSGFPGFTYYSDTCKFYDRNKDLIWELASEMADEMGQESVPEFVASFRCAPSINDETQFKNALAWFALEEVARSFDN